MILDVAVMAVFLVLGGVLFRHFEPFAPWWRRLLKVSVTLCITGAISHYFGRVGVMIAFGIVLVPVIYIHAIWLPRHGVHGWTGEPRDKYYALRGWDLPNS